MNVEEPVTPNEDNIPVEPATPTQGSVVLEEPIPQNEDHSGVQEEGAGNSAMSDDNVDYDVAENRPLRPLSLIHRALEDLFIDEDEIRNFCQKHFPKFARNLKVTDRFDAISVQFAQYCDTRHETQLFWENIKFERPNAYASLYKEWRVSVEYYRDKKSHENTSDIDDGLEMDFETKVEKHHVSDEYHPLRDGELDDVTKWFFEELSAEEQSLAITVALFEGMQLNNLMNMHSVINQWLFEENKFQD